MKKSKGGCLVLNRSICAVNSVEFGSAPTTSYLTPCLSSTGSSTSRALCPPSVFSKRTATFLNPAAAIQSPYLVAISAWLGATRKTSG
jgi:hypothetical protein